MKFLKGFRFDPLNVVETVAGILGERDTTNETRQKLQDMDYPHIRDLLPYPELKAYGYNRPGVVNASVEFNVETLSPTYKLLIGVPGRSNAFEISTRLGLPENIIENAKAYTGTDRHEVDAMIASLEESRRKAEADAERSHHLMVEAEALQKDLDEKLREYEETKEELVKKAKEKARKLVEEAKREAEEVIGELHKMQINANKAIKEHEIIDARKRLEEAAPKENRVLKKQRQVNARAVNLQKGDEVKVISYGQKGTLIEQVSDHQWIVQLGILKMKIDTSDLEYVKPEKTKESVNVSAVRNRDSNVKLELDLRDRKSVV